VGLWDLRQRHPLLVKDHMYGAAIRDIKFHSGGVRQQHGGGGAAAVWDCLLVRCVSMMLGVLHGQGSW
jgi:hypothetical protein